MHLLHPLPHDITGQYFMGSVVLILSQIYLYSSYFDGDVSPSKYLGIHKKSVAKLIKENLIVFKFSQVNI